MFDIKTQLNKVSEIPVSTYKEGRMINYLLGKLAQLGHKSARVRSDAVYDGLAVVQNPNLIFLAHVDRVSVEPRKLHFTEQYVSGQLDNIIGITALLYLLSQKDFKGSVLFTTQEEVVNNKNQIENFVEEYGTEESVLIDVDIDPITTGNTLYKGLSIRGGDSMRCYDRRVTSTLQNLVRKNGFRYLDLGEHIWLVLEISPLTVPNPVGFVGVPILNYHSNKEIAYYQSVVDLCKFLYLVSKEAIENE